MNLEFGLIFETIMFAFAIKKVGVTIMSEKSKSKIKRIAVFKKLKFSSAPILFQIMSDWAGA